jgi:aminoglycoside phosphotransferase
VTVPSPPVFADDEAYEASLRDATFWAPYAKAALRFAGLDDAGEVETHFPTTHVAALVGTDYFVKLHYEDWFGEDCFQTEREAYRMLSDADLPVPELLAEGALYDEGWRWPFLVLSAMHGHSLRDLGDAVSDTDRANVATWLGGALKELHGVPIRDSEHINRDVYIDMIQTRLGRAHRDHEQWGSLREPLAEQIRDYLWKASDLIDPEREKPVFLHGDLHHGNVFVEGESGAFSPTGLVDFNDAYEGDPHYDLVAIHVKTFNGDKALLRRFLESYGWGELGKQWTRRMTALTLAHDFDMIQPIAERIPADVSSLDELGKALWDLDSPGLP